MSGLRDVATDFVSGLPIIGGFFRGADARNQMRRGENERNDLLRRRAAGEFDYHTPNEIAQSLSLAKNAFLDPRMPGQGVAENKLSGNTSQAIGLANTYGRSPSDIIAAITGANANENAGYNDLATKAAMMHIANRGEYEGQLGQTADYKDKEWAYNKYMPYMQDRQYAESMIGAGRKNLATAQNSIGNDMISLATLGIGASGGFGGNNYLSSIFGGGSNNRYGAGNN